MLDEIIKAFDNTFLTNQFIIKGYKVFRRDSNSM